MSKTMSRICLTILMGAAAVLVPASAGGGEVAAGASKPPGAVGCAAEFDKAVQAYVDTTHERDVEGFEALLDDDVTVIFRLGEVLYGKEATMGFIEPFFEATNWTQSFDELTRVVRGCRTGFVLFDSVYTENGEPLPLVIGVTFTYERGRWLVVHNQDSAGPAS